MSDSAPKQEPPYGLRMPPDLKDRVKAAAKANNRSMNAEIVATLEEKYPAPRLSERDEALIQFMLENVPKDEVEAFVTDILKRRGISDDDIRDGLIPGVKLRDE
ncbi:Arc family DNA-binding protein [Roseovarius nitratireducens]|uniref:Arc family DNA-binding protein n=1 Tax=Roseovarius nitratireducens TaxID=2044597 RepID=UPI000CE26673|nr:Arc family DNA-binding protein [Roseovarius nitratireducens]